MVPTVGCTRIDTIAAPNSRKPMVWPRVATPTNDSTFCWPKISYPPHMALIPSQYTEMASSCFGGRSGVSTVAAGDSLVAAPTGAATGCVPSTDDPYWPRGPSTPQRNDVRSSQGRRPYPTQPSTELIDKSACRGCVGRQGSAGRLTEARPVSMHDLSGGLCMDPRGDVGTVNGPAGRDASQCRRAPAR